MIVHKNQQKMNELTKSMIRGIILSKSLFESSPKRFSKYGKQDGDNVSKVYNNS